MNKTFYITIVVFCIAVSSSFYMGAYSYRSLVIQHQKQLIESQQAHKETLEKQARYIRSLNESFGAAADLELEEWKQQITVDTISSK